MKVKKFIGLSIIIYFVILVLMYFTFAVFPGSDLVGGTFTYFGFVMLSATLLHIANRQ